MRNTIAYLGPVGTYTQLVAEKRFGRNAGLLPLPSIFDVCRFVAGNPSCRGIIPIENSSGGEIHETVDVLLLNQPRIHIVEELALNVKLALLARPGEKLHTLYSHFVPLEHCSGWIRRNLPGIQQKVAPSTALAAQKAAEEPGAAVLGNRRLAKIYNLKVLHYPIAANVPNITMFLLISGKKVVTALSPNPKTTVAVHLPNRPGSLCTFLEKFRNNKVNLSRLISRPIRGCLKEYAFLVDLQGDIRSLRVQTALREARQVSSSIRVAGSYPCLAPYNS
jgi:chorismate mutase / prephenate dehydratase